MPTAAPLPTSHPPDSALRAAGVALRRRLRHAAVFMTLMCTGIGVFLAVSFGTPLGRSLVYSFCIGFSCWAMTDGCRLALAWWFDRQRARRGLPVAAHGFAVGWPGMVALMLLGLLAGPVIGLALGDAITGHQSPSLYALDSRGSRITLLMSLFGTLLALFAFSMHGRLAHAREQAESARRAAAEHQLMLLQSQLEPHMLFNTLANLRALIGVEPARAQAMLDRLIAYLRATLTASRATLHPLADEFARLDDYLALMAVRMGPRLQVALHLPAELRGLPVPPLLLQPLVENSIRHGLEPKIEGGRIDIRATQEGERLVLEVQDSGVGLPALGPIARPGAPVPPEAGATQAQRTSADTAGPTRFGLHQVRSRLETLHGSAARLDLRAAPDGIGTLARVELPWPGAAAAAPTPAPTAAP